MFESTILPHLDSAYNLARWLTRNDSDAEDVVQEAFLRALRSFKTFTPGRDGRAWLLAIVRNCCRTWLRENRPQQLAVELDDNSQASGEQWSNPEASLISSATCQLVRQAIEELPVEYREILVLRELEDLSYKEIAAVVEIPIGTVMSRISRARRELYARICQAQGGK